MVRPTRSSSNHRPRAQRSGRHRERAEAVRRPKTVGGVLPALALALLVVAAYGLALGLFAGALLAKTVTCTLPVVLLLVLWWRRGRVDITPLIPFFVLGAASGLVTAWMEAHHVGATGALWRLSLLDRCLIAGRALWFYAGKLLWPHPLAFIYARWHVDAAVWWQYLFPLAAAATVAALHLARG